MIEFFLLFAILVVALLASLEAGFRSGKRRTSEGATQNQSVSIIDSYIMTLLGLLLAFGFNSARDEFNKRNELVLLEAHSVRGALLTFDSLGAEVREPTVALLSQYLESRKQYNQFINDRSKVLSIYAQGRVLLGEMNRQLRAQNSSGSTTYEPTRAALSAVEAMEEDALARHISAFYRRPNVVLTLLISVSLLAGFLLGMGLDVARSAQRWHRIVFAVVTAAVLVMILDYASPRAGLIRVDAADQALNDIRIEAPR